MHTFINNTPSCMTCGSECRCNETPRAENKPTRECKRAVTAESTNNLDWQPVEKHISIPQWQREQAYKQGLKEIAKEIERASFRKEVVRAFQSDILLPQRINYGPVKEGGYQIAIPPMLD